MTAATAPTQDPVAARVDALVSGLFDIGDDINTALVWLAENWSVDLPAPEWTGRLADQHDVARPVLRLRAYCSPDQLARLAALAEVDPSVDRAGPRYRRLVVCRSFGTGRVELWAYCYERPETDR